MPYDFNPRQYFSLSIYKLVPIITRMRRRRNENLLMMLTSLILLLACNNSNQSDVAEDKTTLPFRTIQGEAQGTTFRITCVKDTSDYSAAVDSILKRMDRDLSLWVDNSLIRRLNDFNRTDTVFAFYDSTKFFSVVFDVSREVWQRTGGAFDPSVYPLVDLWGFGLSNAREVNDTMVDSALADVGFDPSRIEMIELESGYIYQETQIRKGNPSTKLDFNAIAQGYTVDVIADYLSQRGVENYMVELGGEVICRGINPQGDPWRIGLDKPEGIVREGFQAVLTPGNKALATSGSYRKYREVDGKRLSHAINPVTGYPVEHNVLSVTVMASSCAIADAYATAFLVMGLDKTSEFLQQNQDLGLEVYIIFDEGGQLQTLITPGMEQMIAAVEMPAQ